MRWAGQQPILWVEVSGKLREPTVADIRAWLRGIEAVVVSRNVLLELRTLGETAMKLLENADVPAPQRGEEG